jgi:hypothetical protein
MLLGRPPKVAAMAVSPWSYRPQLDQQFDDAPLNVLEDLGTPPGIATRDIGDCVR